MRFVPGHFLTEMMICPANGEVLKIIIAGFLLTCRKRSCSLKARQFEKENNRDVWS